MKAHSSKTQKQILRDALNEFISESAPEIVKESEALVLYALYLENFSQDDILRIHSRFKELLDWPEIMGQKAKTRDVMSFMKNTFGISFDDICLEFEEDQHGH